MTKDAPSTSLGDGWEHVDTPRIRQLVSQYPATVPAKLKDLEALRLQSVPEALQTRKKDGKAFLEKDELVGLVEWKLKHGTFRPNLLKLVSSNAAAVVKSSTCEAYSNCDAGNIAAALTALTKLSGIGPATASLMLSAYDPANLPFFSDELFRYVSLESDKNSTLRGWDRKIVYTKKEYDLLRQRVGQACKRLNDGGNDGEPVTALDIEKAAYVLARVDAPDHAVEPLGKRKREEKDIPAENDGGGAEIADAGTSAQRYPKRKRE